MELTTNQEQIISSTLTKVILFEKRNDYSGICPVLYHLNKTQRISEQDYTITKKYVIHYALKSSMFGNYLFQPLNWKLRDIWLSEVINRLNEI